MDNSNFYSQYKYAYKKGYKTFKANKRKGKDPYLKALEEIVNIYDCSIERIGQIDVNTDLIVGTVNTSRKYSFASDFMPLVKGSGDFSTKWMNVCKYHLSDTGISDVPVAFEYLGKFYIEEGNKRVSVLKSYGAVFIPCEVKRLLPLKSDKKEIKLYYEFLNYYKLSKLYSIQFNELGYYKKLQRLMKFDENHEWTREDRIKLVGYYGRLCNALRKLKFGCYYPDALMVLIEIYGFDKLDEMSDRELYKAILESKQKIIYDKAFYNILCVSDEEDQMLWGQGGVSKLKKYDFILSSGDLKSEYLEYLVTIANRPLLYVHGNHDEQYDLKEPCGCVCIDDTVYVHDGIRIAGLGGSIKYKNNSKYMYSEYQMKKRVRKLRRKIRKVGGIDILVTHAPIAGYGDLDDFAHKGFECFVDLIEEFHPKYVFFGHVHARYDYKYTGYYELEGTQIINVSGKRDIVY